MRLCEVVSEVTARVTTEVDGLMHILAPLIADAIAAHPRISKPRSGVMNVELDDIYKALPQYARDRVEKAISGIPDELDKSHARTEVVAAVYWAWKKNKDRKNLHGRAAKIFTHEMESWERMLGTKLGDVLK